MKDRGRKETTNGELDFLFARVLLALDGVEDLADLLHAALNEGGI